MKILFVEYPACSTCQKARKWLDAHEISYESRHIKDQRPTAEELSRIVRRPLINNIFTSTSFENLGLPGRDTELWLTVPAGYRGCQFLQPVARPKFKDQIEVLFARGLKYRITDAKIENGKYVLFAEVLK